MRKVFGTRRRKVFGMAGVALVALALVTTAAAFYGGSGTGTAAASAGAAPRSVTVSGATNPNTALYPGESRPLDITVTLVGPGSARVGSVSLAAAGITNSNSGAGCLDSWFTFTPPSSGFGIGGSNVSAGSPLILLGASSGAAVSFTDAAVNQDACNLAAITVNLQASPS